MADGVLLVLELEEAPPAVLPVVPVPVVELLDASAPGAGDGVGVVVVLLLLLEGAAAGGGVVTVVSSFLPQATRPTAIKAAMRSERFIFIVPLGDHHTGFTENGRRWCMPSVSDLRDRHEHFTSSARAMFTSARLKKRR